jgi:hypothetical protein
MKKNVLALSIAAMIGGLGFAGSASAALSVAESGSGHMLLVPYYTAQNGNMTVFHVVNTDTAHGKAMKVRFRGAANSDDVLDFQVFMSPGDVWTAAVTQGSDGVANLVTADATCTLPAIAKGVPVPFVQDRLPSAMSAADKANNTREGYVEIFNMADILKVGLPTDSGYGRTLYGATKHVNGVAPCTDSVLLGTLDKAAATNDADLGAPTNGLTGSWYVINVPQTTTFSGAATAIKASAPVTASNLFSPQKAGAASAALTTADPLFKAKVLAAQNYDVPDLSTPYDTAYASADAQAAALTAQLARTAVINQYANDASITAKTDWVFSMPTRRYSIAANYAAPVSQGYATVTGTTATPVSPATAQTAYRYINNDVTTSYFVNPLNTSVNAIGQICTNASGQVFFDREETSKRAGAVFSPGQLSVTQLCGEVSVLSFADTGASVLGASVARSNVTGVYTNGWGAINFAAPGVPVLGASFIKLTNPQATTGVSGNYGITWPHAYENAPAIP